MKKLGLFLSAGVAALAISAPSAAVYPPAGGTLTLAPSTATPGASVTATFFGCQLGETVNFTLDGTTVTGGCNGPAGEAFFSATTGPSASATLTAPTEPGTYTVTATGQTSGATASATLTVAAATVPSGGLPATGSDSVPVVQIGAGLVAVGAGLAVVARVRRHKAAAAA